ncbi:hypothetical protein X992_4153 [Burkholderia pseudomallei MSHR5492]|nr:hypothetical protein X992_4153 [Burkholderia pseudomallei MSHR5492]
MQQLPNDLFGCLITVDCISLNGSSILRNISDWLPRRIAERRSEPYRRKVIGRREEIPDQNILVEKCGKDSRAPTMVYCSQQLIF